MATYDAGLVNATAISRFEAHDYFLDGRHDPPGGAGETIETLPMMCPPEEEMELLLRLSLEAERAYFPGVLRIARGQGGVGAQVPSDAVGPQLLLCERHGRARGSRVEGRFRKDEPMGGTSYAPETLKPTFASKTKEKGRNVEGNE